MKNKKTLFLAVAAVVGASATVAAISGSTEALAKVFAAGGVEYHHYAAIDPTLDKPGIREFYKACDGSAPVFEAPAGAQIVESVLTEEQKAAIIAEGGARVIKPYVYADHWIQTYYGTQEEAESNTNWTYAGATANGKVVVSSMWNRPEYYNQNDYRGGTLYLRATTWNDKKVSATYTFNEADRHATNHISFDWCTGYTNNSAHVLNIYGVDVDGAEYLLGTTNIVAETVTDYTNVDLYFDTASYAGFKFENVAGGSYSDTIIKNIYSYYSPSKNGTAIGRFSQYMAMNPTTYSDVAGSTKTRHTGSKIGSVVVSTAFESTARLISNGDWAYNDGYDASKYTSYKVFVFSSVNVTVAKTGYRWNPIGTEPSALSAGWNEFTITNTATIANLGGATSPCTYFALEIPSIPEGYVTALTPFFGYAA